jgi:hypothetical protein
MIRPKSENPFCETSTTDVYSAGFLTNKWERSVPACRVCYGVFQVIVNDANDVGELVL